MERSTQVLDLAEKLHDALDADVQVLTPLQVGAVIREAAELAVDEMNEERAATLAYLSYHGKGDARIGLLIAQMEIGAHRRNRSQSIEAIVERS